MITTECPICHKKFEARIGEVHKGFGKFCSRECFHKSLLRIQDVRCLICDKKFHPKRGAIYCSRKCFSDARKIKSLGNKKVKGGYVYIKTIYGYVQEHRYILEQKLGRQLARSEIIHHKNGNKKDNRLENLEVTNISKHIILHFKGVPKSKEHREKLKHNLEIARKIYSEMRSCNTI